MNSRWLVRLVLAIAPLVMSASAWGEEADTPDNTDQPTEGRSIKPDPGKVGEEQTHKTFLKTFVNDEWRMWSSPFRTGSYDRHTVMKYVVPFAAIAGTLIATDRELTHALPDSPGQTKWSNRVSDLGAWYTVTAVTGGTLLMGRLGGNDHMSETGWLGLQAVAHSQLIVFGMKQITNRQRPIDPKARGGFWQGGDSFPSGHSMTSFAVATIFAYEYREHIAAPIAAYSLATAISLSRLSGRRHWMSDIFVGGSSGFLIGRYVYKKHHDPSLPGSPVARSRKLIPEFGMGMTGPTLTWRLGS